MHINTHMKQIYFLIAALSISLVSLTSESKAQNINTIIGTGVAGYSGNGSIATGAMVNNASSVAIDTIGNLYIADVSNNVVRKVNATTGIITVFAGGGSASASGVLSGPATAVALNSPTGVAADLNGNIFIAVRGDGKLAKVNSAGIISTIDSAGVSAAGGLDPISVAVDRYGNAYYADYNRNKIWKKNFSTGTITSVAGLTFPGYDGDGGPATAAHLNGPTGVAVDTMGNVYIADNGNNVVRNIDASGVIKTLVGTGGFVYWDYTNNTSTTSLNQPYGVAVDRTGNVYISDANNNVIRKVNASYVVSTIAGTATAGYSGDGAVATSALLNGPLGLCVSFTGNLYIADNSNYRIRLLGTLPSWLTGSGSSANRIPVFVNGHSQNTTACTNTTIALNSLLAVHDSDASQTETWSLYEAPLFGTATVAYSTTSTGSIITPSGLSYTTATGFMGTDSFSVRVTDGSDTTYTTIRVTVAEVVNVSAIFGTSTVCAGNTTTLINGIAGGVWSSSNTGIATVNASGVVTGVSAGAATISYVLAGGCNTAFALKSFTVNPGTAAGTLSGPATVVLGGNISLSATVSGGVWSSSNTAVATVSTTGIVTGIAAGAATISYSVSGSCGTAYATAGITVTGGSTGSGSALIISTIAGNHDAGYSGDGGTATAATLLSPSGIAVNAAGTIYFVDQANNRVRKVTTSGIISTVAGNGIAGNSGDGGAADAASLNNPMGVAVDLAGNLYIADYGNAKIRKVHTSGIITTIAGNGAIGYSPDGTPATAAQIATPTGVTVDAAGNVYFAEQNNHVVRKVNTSGIINTVAGNRGAGFSGDGGLATDAALSYPFNVITDPSGNIYISDAGNHRIRKVNAAGNISTIAGSGTSGGYAGDGGAATAALLNNPAGIAFDGTGSLLIADLNNNCIRKVTSGGIISTIAGSTAGGFSGDDSDATAASMYKPSGLAVSGDNIYFTDMGNNVVRMVAETGARAYNGSSEPGTGFDKSFAVSISPNPSTGILHIKADDNNKDEISVTVISTSGQIIYQSGGNSPYGLLTISTENWSSGLYLIRVSAGYKFATRQLVITN